MELFGHVIDGEERVRVGAYVRLRRPLTRGRRGPRSRSAARRRPTGR